MASSRKHDQQFSSDDVGDSVSDAADDAADADAEDWRGALGRFGIAARGMLYMVLGILALQFAFGSGGAQQVSDRGAIAFVQQQPFGTVLLWILALGLTALALWQFTIAVTGDPVEGDEAKDRAMYALKGFFYGVTAVAAYAALGIDAASSGGGSGGGGGGSGQTEATAWILQLPFGRWIVGAIGLGVIGYAIKTFMEDVKDSEFMHRLKVGQMDPDTTKAVRTTGRAGYGGRGTVIGITGIFLIVAAVQYSPDSTRGLAGALLALSRQPYGPWLLTAVALGLFLFGVFSVAEARYRRAA